MVDEMINQRCIHLLDIPKGMKFQSYVIEENMKQADLFYEYKGETIRYEIYLNQTDSSKGMSKRRHNRKYI